MNVLYHHISRCYWESKTKEEREESARISIRYISNLWKHLLCWCSCPRLTASTVAYIFSNQLRSPEWRKSRSTINYKSTRHAVKCFLDKTRSLFLYQYTLADDHWISSVVCLLDISLFSSETSEKSRDATEPRRKIYSWVWGYLDHRQVWNRKI